jgi:hypothetical protein
MNYEARQCLYAPRIFYSPMAVCPRKNDGELTSAFYRVELGAGSGLTGYARTTSAPKPLPQRKNSH